MEKTPRRGEGQKLCRIFYLERFVFTSWLIVAIGYFSLGMDMKTICHIEVFERKLACVTLA